MTDAPDTETGDLEAGTDVIAARLKTLPDRPGVYRMLDAKGDALYVGKAKSLKKRVAAYTKAERLPIRLRRMVARTAALEIVTTHTEAEALLLESNLIKRLAPRYNILLRDDKSFPFILIPSDHPWPQIVKHRGAQTRKGDYFGPFASAGAVNQTLAVLQRVFLLRTCSDSVFAGRTRPCLLHQIKRCSAPCVERISQDAYLTNVNEARAFLAGKSRDLQTRFAERMQDAADALDYETAAMFRDRIRALTKIQAHQDISLPHIGDADVIAVHQDAGQACVQVFFFRAGQNFGARAYFPAHTEQETPSGILEAFLGQFYAAHKPPPLILLSHSPTHGPLLEKALALRSEEKVDIQVPQKGDKRKLVDHARANAQDALTRRMAETHSQQKLLEGLAETFGLESAPQRIEVYDNSHIQGAHALGAMIVAGPEGLMKNAYRKFTIHDTDTSPGDDYAMLREVLMRRFSRALKEDPDRTRNQWPDLVLIDGGQGQLSVACQVMADLGIDDLPLAAIAKGPERNAGRERFFLQGRPAFSLKENDPVLFYLQRLRDEAHRFAIGAHRAKRSRSLSTSPLDEVPGIGAARKRALLHHFGSARAVTEAGLTDLEAVPGVSKGLAKKIYDRFHPGG